MVEGEMLEPPESDFLRDNEPFWEQSEEGQAGETNSRCHFLRQEDNLRPHLRQSTRNQKLPACCWTYLQMLPNLKHVGRCKTMWKDVGGTHSDILFESLRIKEASTQMSILKRGNNLRIL